MVCLSLPHGIRSSLCLKETNNVVDDPVNKGYRDRSLRDYAVARFAATQLACGKGLISDADDKYEWEGSPIQKNDNRKNPIIWLNKSVLLFESADEFAPYGRHAGRAVRGFKRLASLEEPLFTTRRLPLVILRTWENAHSRVDTIPSSSVNPSGLQTPTRISLRPQKGNATCLTCGLLIPDAVMILFPVLT